LRHDFGREGVCGRPEISPPRSFLKVGAYTVDPYHSASAKVGLDAAHVISARGVLLVAFPRGLIPRN